MGALGTLATLMTGSIIAFAMAGPAMAGIFGPPIVAEQRSLGDGWATLAFEANGADVTLQVEAEGNATRVYRIDVYDEVGALLAAYEAPTFPTQASGGAQWAGNSIPAEPQINALGGAAWAGIYGRGDCLDSGSLGVSENLASGERRTWLALHLDHDCLGEGPIRAALVSAGPDVRDSRFQLRSEGEPVLLDWNSGGSVSYVPIREFGGYAEAAAQINFLGAAFAWGASRTYDLDDEWIGSFGLGVDRIVPQLPNDVTARAPSGTLQQCPCFAILGEEQGPWMFRASGAFDAEPYLLVADIEWP